MKHKELLFKLLGIAGSSLVVLKSLSIIVWEIEVDDAPVAVGVIHRNDISAPRRVGVKSDVNVLAGIVFQQFALTNPIHPDGAIDPQYLLATSTGRFIPPKNS